MRVGHAGSALVRCLTLFGRLFAASAVSNLGDGLRLTALPLLAASLTRDPATIATMSAATRWQRE